MGPAEIAATKGEVIDFSVMKKTAEHAKAIRDNELAQVQDSVRSWLQAMEKRDETARRQTIVYYRDDNGEGEPKSYYTDDLRLEPQHDGSGASAA